MRQSCYFYTEKVRYENNPIQVGCKLFDEPKCEGCGWHKTGVQYDARQVERDIARYELSHGGG